MYSLKLKTAMSEILEILKRHDIAGRIILHEPGFSEYSLHLNPSWSCMSWVDNSIEVKSLLADYATAEDQNQVISNSINMLKHFSRYCEQDLILFKTLETVLSDYREIEHEPFFHLPASPESRGLN